MKLIYFKWSDGGVWVNPERIVFIEERGEDNVYIDLGAKSWTIVKEPIEDVLMKLRDAGIAITD